MKKVWVLLAVVLVLIVGCSNKDSAKPDLSKLTPEQVVETYYTSISKGDVATAKACLDDNYVKRYSSSDAFDLNNLSKVSNIKVEKGISMPSEDKAQVVAEFEAVYKKIITSNNGKQIRFIYLTKVAKDSVWKITEIGTGP